ncbi:hypothetical protein FHS31_001566 [Sphingomonas vulcanisoli]|uniref:Uncharacterized protein n=1 Tax=Sphingomonas vulcanisoli TaxID=1658060 RepID=A0ABX0TR81_9SPHN|nr:hypothetical protein [Sphingomonas vulcanisoli]NIJ07956.1 hypothetical protein [Sphingomonas vulcanisoli]
MSRVAVRPYLVAKDEEGAFRITVRTTRFNSQGYPLVSTEMLGDTFPTATKARAYLRETYRAEAIDIATK